MLRLSRRFFYRGRHAPPSPRQQSRRGLTPTRESRLRSTLATDATNFRTVTLGFVLLGLAAVAARVRADAGADADHVPPEFSGSGRVARPLASTNREDATAAGTEIELRDRTAALESVSDVLLEVPGARPFRTGAFGSYTSASLRGAEIEHTVVLFGEIPISSADAAAFNLSTVPVSLLERVTVYRGGAPAWLSQGAIGGVVQLVPKEARGRELAATATAGTLGTYGVQAESSLVPRSAGAPSLLAAVGVLGSSGDFDYRFDNKTSFDTSDDYTAPRKNADFVDGSGLLRLRQPLGKGALEVLLLGLSRAAGEPGAPADPAFEARRDFTRGLIGLDYDYELANANGERKLRAQALAVLGFERAFVSDRFGEIARARGTLADEANTQALGRLAGSYAVNDYLELTLVGSAQRELRSIEDPLAAVPQPASDRTTLAGVGEINAHGELAGHRVELRPSLRLEHDLATLGSERFGAAVRHDIGLTLATYRVGVAIGLARALSLNGSVASGARTPSMLELFGDAAFIDGNPALNPEHSRSYDVGLVATPAFGWLRGSCELRGFALDIRDEIVFIRQSFNQFVPLNLAQSHIVGLEAGARVLFGQQLWLNASASLLATEGKPGKQLPNRPPAIAFVQPGVTLRPDVLFDTVQLYAEASYAGASYDDPDNQTRLKPALLLFGLGAALGFLRGQAELRVAVNDLFDHGGADLRHFPLPGRTLMASLKYRESVL